ncbi:hypothetical protein [Arthrobacter sp. Bz4]|uniref:hypothetical protein n=1 Tax=Arthrobacter sp. Bz4 TaxID=2171979 RepID=UPI00140370E8|nr:hypothetical protein [Arthrobacter sp. Bz4]
MLDDQDYVEVDAVIRMPKGRRLADSKKTDGWSRGFTPNSADKGPEHVEIRLKPDVTSAENDTTPVEPQIIFIHENIDSPPQKTREQEELEEILGLLITLGFVKATEWMQPRLQRIWRERVIPFFNFQRGQWRAHMPRRRAGKRVESDVPTTASEATPVNGTNEVGDALDAYEANMSSGEARQHFAEALIARHFANERCGSWPTLV